ncbi:MAG TPA: transcription factor FapR [Firmicutes bacterium]|nr:transcription factor FapR [Bacillota bacterium]
MPKLERQRELRKLLEQNPFLSDVELATRFGVSVQTIRLDRVALGIGDVRQRTRAIADRVRGVVKSLAPKEVVGDIIEIHLGDSGVSILETTQDMVFQRTRVVRGQYIFAQADSLAIALVDADVVLTGLANIKFKRPVKVGEKLVARAEVIKKKGNKWVILVVTCSGADQVFRGKFVVFALSQEEGGKEGRVQDSR